MGKKFGFQYCQKIESRKNWIMSELPTSKTHKCVCFPFSKLGSTEQSVVYGSLVCIALSFILLHCIVYTYWIELSIIKWIFVSPPAKYDWYIIQVAGASFRGLLLIQEGSGATSKYFVMLGWTIWFYRHLKHWPTSDHFMAEYIGAATLPYLIEIFTAALLE